MSTIDLSQYNLAELDALRQDIDKEINGRANEELKKAREQILAIAQSVGLSIEQLLALPGKRGKTTKGTTVAAQYRNPDDASKTWTGRGRQPKWIGQALANGKKLDDLRV